jgi:hypothetical protein
MRSAVGDRTILVFIPRLGHIAHSELECLWQSTVRQLSLAGPIVEVCGYARTSPVHRMETEDLVCAAVRFASGAVGVIDATTAAYPGGPERIELIATLGRPRSPARRSPCAFTMAAARRWRRTRHRAARAPTRWPSNTTITWACGAISSTRSNGKGAAHFRRRGPQGASPDRRPADGRRHRPHSRRPIVTRCVPASLLVRLDLALGMAGLRFDLAAGQRLAQRRDAALFDG